MSRDQNQIIMPKYVIERHLPGAGKLSAEQLKEVAQTSCDVLRTMSPEIQWVQTYVTDNKFFCVFNSPNPELIREHSEQAGFPVNSVHKVAVICDPVYAE